MLFLRQLFRRRLSRGRLSRGRLFRRRMTLCVMLGVPSRDCGFNSGDTGCGPAVNAPRLLFTILALVEVRLAGQLEIGGLR